MITLSGVRSSCETGGEELRLDVVRLLQLAHLLLDRGAAGAEALDHGVERVIRGARARRRPRAATRASKSPPAMRSAAAASDVSGRVIARASSTAAASDASEEQRRPDRRGADRVAAERDQRLDGDADRRPCRAPRRGGRPSGGSAAGTPTARARR